MPYDGPVDCPDQDCLVPVVFDDFTCEDGVINQAWFDKLNGIHNQLAEAICCVANSIPDNLQAIQFLPNPVTIFRIIRTLLQGTFDTGNINLNLNSLIGVTVPAGATGVLLQSACSVSGDQLQIGQSIAGEFAQIEVASTVGQLNGGNFSDPTQAPTLVTYADTNLGGNDNDNTSYPMIELNGGTNIAYRGKLIFQNLGFGLTTSTMSLRVIGFTF